MPRIPSLLLEIKRDDRKKNLDKLLCMKSIRNQLLIHLTELFNWKICRNTIYFALLCSHFTWFCRWFSQKSFRIMFCIQEKKTTTYLFDIKWHSAKSFSCATKNAHVTHSWSSWNIACKSEREQWKIHLDNCTNKNFDVTLYMCIWNRVFMCVTVISMWCLWGVRMNFTLSNSNNNNFFLKHMN